MRTDLTGISFIVVTGEQLASGDLEAALRRRGAFVVVAPDCVAAFEALERQKPDFAILDWEKPECEAVADELRALDVPYLYLGTPRKRDRAAVRDQVSLRIASLLVTMIADDAALPSATGETRR